MKYKEFFQYVIPSMIAFAFSGIYSIVDGWFIGNTIGADGLAAINVAYPLTAIILATGSGIGMGGAILISISQGKKDELAQRNYMGLTIGILFLAGILEMIVFYQLYPAILHFFGATGTLMTLGSEYIRWIIYGTLFQVIGTGLVPLARNYNGAVTAMISMICGFGVNVILDWYFIAVLDLGLMGAAGATVFGQAVAILPSLIFLIKQKKIFGYMKFSFDAKKVREILFVGASPFGLTLSPSVILIIINKAAIFYGGARAAACYAVVCYVVYIVQMLLQGVGDGSQPLISRYYGLGQMDTVKQLRKLAYLTAEVLAVASVILLVALRRPVAVFFGMEGVGIEDVAVALPIFCAGFIFIAVLKVTSSSFYAVKKNIYAYVLIYGELVGIAILAGMVLPKYFGVTGVWLSVPATQILLAALAVILYKRHQVEEKLENKELNIAYSA